jgi:hypothetical protein
MPGQLPDWLPPEPLDEDPVDGFVDGVVVVEFDVDGVVEDELEAALAIAAPPPPMTPAAPRLSRAIRNRFMGLHLLRHRSLPLSEPAPVNEGVNARCEFDTGVLL